jgi:hypothetical protein
MRSSQFFGPKAARRFNSATSSSKTLTRSSSVAISDIDHLAHRKHCRERWNDTAIIPGGTPDSNPAHRCALQSGPTAVLSTAGPSKGHNLLVFGALSDVAASDIAERERDVILRVHLEDVYHLTSALRTVRVFDALYPRRPAGQFIP